VGIGAYLLGKQQGSEPAKTAATAPTPDAGFPATPTSAARVPSGHPPIAASTQPSDGPPLSGRTGADGSAPFTHFRVGQRNVKAIVPDGNIMWVGTSGGVIRYNTQNDKYKLFDVRSGLLARGVFHLSKLDGRLVVGTYGGGMAIMKDDENGWELYNIPDGLADAFVYDVLQADNGDVWIATWSGANRVRGGALRDRSKWDTFTVSNTKGGLPNDWVYALAKGANGAVWLATEGGLAHFKDNQWRNWQHKDGLGAPYELVKGQIAFTSDPARFSKHHARQKVEMGLENVDVAYNPNYIVALTVDRDGVVWSGTWGGGLSRFDGKKWTTYTVADGLPGNHIFMLHEDTKGQLWIGTNNGLVRRDGDHFKVFTTADGLFTNMVFAMATAADGSRWVGSFGGVARVSRLP
jgi:ligand-binding sensor domain-containing protein